MSRQRSFRPKNPHLAAAMARSGKSARRLAAETGIHPNTISRLLNRRSATTPETAAKLATALRCSVPSLRLEVIAGRTSDGFCGTP